MKNIRTLVYYLTAGIDGRTVHVAKLPKACVADLEALAQKNYRPISAE